MQLIKIYSFSKASRLLSKKTLVENLLQDGHTEATVFSDREVQGCGKVGYRTASFMPQNQRVLKYLSALSRYYAAERFGKCNRNHNGERQKTETSHVASSYQVLFSSIYNICVSLLEGMSRERQEPSYITIILDKRNNLKSLS